MRRLAAAALLGLVAPIAGGETVPVPLGRPDPGAAAPGRSGLADDPAPVRRFACPALLQGLVAGRLAPPLRDGECGETSPLEIGAAGGVALTGKPLVTCAMAGEVAWLAAEAGRLSAEILGSPLKALVTGPGYECRNRNRAEAGKLSEHAFANAMDVAGFRLADGREIGVEKHWPHWQPHSADPAAQGNADPAQTGAPAAPKAPPAAERATSAEARFLTAVHAAACGRFTTVLGPDANAYHRGHFHFDLGCHGRACDFRICE
jgi:hypothetical protein